MKKYIEEYFRDANLAKPEINIYLSGEALVNSKDIADIAFLDVKMPGLNGIRAGNALKKLNPLIKIFILTSYIDYLDEAMKFHVFRYLTKPIDKNRLFINLKEALYQIEIESMPIPIETNEKIIIRQASDVIFVESERKKSCITLVDSVYHSLSPMKEWAKLLKIKCFYQTHRSYIVNMKYVSSFSKDMIELADLRGNSYRAYLTKRNYMNFKKSYLLYLESMQ
jgi:two-component system LytT family response regulator